jgi:flagellar motility protein MotE (MotC chaperone)
MDASIKKKLKEIKAKEKGLKTPEAKQKRYRKLEERRNDRLDQLYREYTAKYQAA